MLEHSWTNRVSDFGTLLGFRIALVVGSRFCQPGYPQLDSGSGRSESDLPRWTESQLDAISNQFLSSGPYGYAWSHSIRLLDCRTNKTNSRDHEPAQHYDAQDCKLIIGYTTPHTL